ncbi:MAG: hypothetical protein KJ587_13840 [Alphaproteobacteria bacterium]|nr:hypothetical protein [Alphaproteobacteria bacterium]
MDGHRLQKSRNARAIGLRRAIHVVALMTAAIASSAAAVETAPTGQWLGATGVDSLPEIVRLKTQEGDLLLRYENDRKCQVHARYVTFEDAFFKYRIGDSTCPHAANPTAAIWIRQLGDKLEYRIARNADKTTAEVGYLYKD